jgi:hypothetical protein
MMMDNRQAVRAARKMIDRLITAEGGMIADLQAFGFYDAEPAISETAKRLNAGFKHLGITLNDFAREIKAVVKIEGRFSGENPPQAWDQAMWAVQAMRQIEAEL